MKNPIVSNVAVIFLSIALEKSHNYATIKNCMYMLAFNYSVH